METGLNNVAMKFLNGKAKTPLLKQLVIWHKQHVRWR